MSDAPNRVADPSGQSVAPIPRELRLTGRARRVMGWTTTVTFAGLGMTGIVFADNNLWVPAGATFGMLGFAFYALGGAAYRLRQPVPGRLDADTMFRVRTFDLAKGSAVRRSWVVPSAVVVRVGRRRCRVFPGVGSVAAIREWLQTTDVLPQRQ